LDLGGPGSEGLAERVGKKMSIRTKAGTIIPGKMARKTQEASKKARKEYTLGGGLARDLGSDLNNGQLDDLIN
jgi:hypothetical protein